MIYIGCISGTSVDALDLAAVQIKDQQLTILAAAAADIPSRLRDELLNLGQAAPTPGTANSDIESAGIENSGIENSDIEKMARLDAALGRFVGEQILHFVHAQGWRPQDIAAVGSHGQTIRHRPGQFTLQIGDPNRIVEACGITTVADFRRRDTAAGGQGAPLVPPFHQALFGGQTDNQHTAVLNIGGISNVTLLGQPPSGFDTGPGNGLLDAWCQQHTGQRYDADGNWAASGKVDEKLLQTLLADDYFALAPPKSTGREYFNLAWLLPRLENQAANDVQNTLCELTALGITRALQQWAPHTSRVVVCGGGRLNGFLMQRLQANHSAQILASEAVGVDGDSLEAAAFAWLAYRTMTHQVGNEPKVTGADGYRLLGGVYFAE